MYLQYGNYRHASGEVTLSPISAEAIFTEAMIVYAVRSRWSIKGFLQATTPALLTAAIANLQNAYALAGQNLGLFNDDGTATAHGVFSFQTIGGVRIVQPPSFPVGEGAEYSTFRTYEIVVEFDRHDPTVGLLSWHDEVEQTGGGPGYVIREPRFGPAIIQQVTQSRAYRYTQSGSAVGHLDWPVPPTPNWPANLIESPNVKVGSPKRKGDQFVEFPISWNYQFASVVPLIGFPVLQPNR